MRRGGAIVKHVLDDHLHDLFPVELIVKEQKRVSHSYIHLSVMSDSRERELWRTNQQKAKSKRSALELSDFLASASRNRLTLSISDKPHSLLHKRAHVDMVRKCSISGDDTTAKRHFI
jgi:hypothetical protein